MSKTVVSGQQEWLAMRFSHFLWHHAFHPVPLSSKACST
jgi:hypothetical protein